MLLCRGGRTGEGPRHPGEEGAPGVDLGAVFLEERLKPTLSGCGGSLRHGGEEGGGAGCCLAGRRWLGGPRCNLAPSLGDVLGCGQIQESRVLLQALGSGDWLEPQFQGL